MHIDRKSDRIKPREKKLCCLKRIGASHIFIKNLVKACDLDFTKATPEEARQIEAAEQSGFIAEGDIDWDHSTRCSCNAMNEKLLMGLFSKNPH